MSEIVYCMSPFVLIRAALRLQESTSLCKPDDHVLTERAFK